MIVLVVVRAGRLTSMGLSLPTLELVSARPNRPMLEPSATTAAEAVSEIAPTVARVFRRSMGRSFVSALVSNVVVPP